jgi:hypothetical protein
MEACEGVDKKFHAFLTSAVAGINGQIHVTAALSPSKEPPVPIGKRLGKPQNILL